MAILMSKDDYGFLLHKLYPKESYWTNPHMTIDEKMMEICSLFGLARDPLIVIGEGDGDVDDEIEFQLNLAQALKVVPKKFAELCQEEKARGAISSTLLEVNSRSNGDTIILDEDNNINVLNAEDIFPDAEISIIKKPNAVEDGDEDDLKNNSTNGGGDAEGGYEEDDDEAKSQAFRRSVLDQLMQSFEEDLVVDSEEEAEGEGMEEKELAELKHIKSQIAKGREILSKSKPNKNDDLQFQTQFDDSDLV